MTDQPHTDATEALAEVARLKYDAAIDRLADATGVRWETIAALLAPENHRALLDALTAAGALVPQSGRGVLVNGKYLTQGDAAECHPDARRYARLVTPWVEVHP